MSSKQIKTGHSGVVVNVNGLEDRQAGGKQLPAGGRGVTCTIVDNSTPAPAKPEEKTVAESKDE